ncbi:phosphohexomutase domain-containing protein [Crassaminicella thermophila]|uniref:hypothetical protein n=1 Tax=Crassaminicella thermophila TaxID=2599308 RepID=UPI001E62BF0F|nr:hypothetical protein [Crassaminicella thermophila]
MKNLSKIRRNSPKIILSARSKNVLDLSSEFLGYMGCQVQCEYVFDKHENIDAHIDYVSKQVKKNKGHIGMVISSNGEKLILIDEKGRIIDQDMYMVLAALISLKAGANQKIVAPYTAPRIIDQIAQAYKAYVVRTKTNQAAIMNEMLDGEHDDMYLQYILNYDGVWAAGKIIDFMMGKDLNLSSLVDEIPNFHLVKKEIECDWKEKGRVIKEIIVNHRDRKMELFEGVKILDDKGWALILPDSERPVFNVYTEGFSQEYAQELSTQFSQKVEAILKNNKGQ